MEQHISLVITILSAIVSLSFYIASRRSETDTLSTIREWTAQFDGRLDKQQIRLSSKFQRSSDRNSTRITNLEARMEYFESAFEDPSYFKMVETLNQGLPGEDPIDEYET